MSIESFTWASTTVIVAGVATLAIYSFLIKENGFYRFFEHLFIGIAAGYMPVFTLKDFLWPKIIQPLLGMDIVVYPDGTSSSSYSPFLLLYIFPMCFGMLYYFIYSKRHSWLARLVIGFSLGASAGLTFKGFFVEMMPQVSSSFRPLVVFCETVSDGCLSVWGSSIDIWSSINNIVFVVTLLTVMYYFFFSVKGGDGRLHQVARRSGRLMMMVCFGAFFGSTVMARLALLVERMQFLLIDWYQAIAALVSG